jgi:hypothetical protein
MELFHGSDDTKKWSENKNHAMGIYKRICILLETFKQVGK